MAVESGDQAARVRAALRVLGITQKLSSTFKGRRDGTCLSGLGPR